MKIVLASTSTRRQELLKQIFDEFSCVAPQFDEGSVKIKNAKQRCMTLSCQKCKVALNNCDENTVIIASDTVVDFNGHILEKPKDKQDAYNMIKSLSGNEHKVHTAVTVYFDKKYYTFCETATVYVDYMNDGEIENYVNTVNNQVSDNKHCYIWEGKAGAYGIQDVFGARYIKGIKGDYYTVMGLPVNRLYKLFRKLGVLDLSGNLID